jgi:hypothetical protein
VVEKVALGHFFSEYFGFFCQLSFRLLLHIHHCRTSMARTICQTVADVPSGLSLTPPHPKKLKLTILMMAKIISFCGNDGISANNRDTIDDNMVLQSTKKNICMAEGGKRGWKIRVLENFKIFTFHRLLSHVAYVTRQINSRRFRI